MAPKKQAKDSKKHKEPAQSRRGTAASKRAQTTISEPAKFGIEHFWGRLTQNASQSTQQADTLSEITVPDKPSEIPCDRLPHKPSEVPCDRLPHKPESPEETSCDQLYKDLERTPVFDKKSEAANNRRFSEGLKTPMAEISEQQECTPEAHICMDFETRLGTGSDSGSLEKRKRMKRSPALLIKQTQDDGVDDVKYKKTPIIVRLESITKRRHKINQIQLNAHQLNCTPIRACMERKDMSTILQNASKLNCAIGSEEKSKNLALEFWAEAINCANYIQNCIPQKAVQDKTPKEAWSGEKPDVSVFCVFGSKAFAVVLDDKCKSMEKKSQELIFVGHCKNVKAYRLLDPVTHDVSFR
ncbi:hypothetical protein KI387_040970 [Taxus chinensis]|uniref:Retroviral polymerase SH3-like domain-containing protein n=1 Tax=Taxus chinensis TaxID=29808 RepID=A0AA38F9D0_TAXCH|nr:hypothetical protein KI387_040970 [Taxus chinensis]